MNFYALEGVFISGAEGAGTQRCFLTKFSYRHKVVVSAIEHSLCVLQSSHTRDLTRRTILSLPPLFMANHDTRTSVCFVTDQPPARGIPEGPHHFRGIVFRRVILPRSPRSYQNQVCAGNYSRRPPPRSLVLRIEIQWLMNSVDP